MRQMPLHWVEVFIGRHLDPAAMPTLDELLDPSAEYTLNDALGLSMFFSDYDLPDLRQQALGWPEERAERLRELLRLASYGRSCGCLRDGAPPRRGCRG